MSHEQASPTTQEIPNPEGAVESQAVQPLFDQVTRLMEGVRYQPVYIHSKEVPDHGRSAEFGHPDDAQNGDVIIKQTHQREMTTTEIRFRTLNTEMSRAGTSKAYKEPKIEIDTSNVGRVLGYRYVENGSEFNTGEVDITPEAMAQAGLRRRIATEIVPDTAEALVNQSNDALAAAKPALTPDKVSSLLDVLQRTTVTGREITKLINPPN